MARWIADLGVNRYIVLVGSMFVNGTAFLLLSMPVVYSIILHLGFDPFWFGILVIKTIEVGLVTPPVSITVYIVHGIASHIPLARYSVVFPPLHCSLFPG